MPSRPWRLRTRLRGRRAATPLRPPVRIPGLIALAAALSLQPFLHRYIRAKVAAFTGPLKQRRAMPAYPPRQFAKLGFRKIRRTLFFPVRTLFQVKSGRVTRLPQEGNSANLICLTCRKIVR